MSDALIFAEHRQGDLLPITAQAVTAAVSLGLSPVVLVIGTGEVAAKVAALTGVAQVLHVEAGEFDSDTYVRAGQAIIKKRSPALVISGQSSQSMSYAAAIAAKLDFGLVTDVLGLSQDGDAILAERAFYGGKVHGEIEIVAGAAMVTLRGGEFAEVETGGSAAIDAISPDLGTTRTAHVSYEEAKADDAGIENAEIILSVGRGVGEEDELERFQELAESLGAAFGVSRPIVDAGWLPVSRQVGQSGKTVAPKVYIALGISGASQHLAGIKGADTVIAVNTDPSAGIFNVAKYGAHCDMHELADELEDLLD